MDRIRAAVTSATAITAAQLIGAQSAPSPNHPRTALWYALLRKPSTTPPGVVFGLAWTALDTLLGYTGYRLMQAKPSPMRGVALSLWALDVAGVAGFSWVLFGKKRLAAATGVSGAMLAGSIGTVAAAAEIDRPAALASVPLVLWLSFATFLQEEVWRRNR